MMKKWIKFLRSASLGLMALLISLLLGVPQVQAGTNSWTIDTSTDPGTDNYLYGVAATSTSDVWAVGHYTDVSHKDTIIEHWNGSAWSTITSVNPGNNNVLNAVAAVSSTNAWAVGYWYDSPALLDKPLIEHWNGSTWVTQTVTLPSGATHAYLDGVAAKDTSNLWAVGNWIDSSGDPQPLLVKWNTANSNWDNVNISTLLMGARLHTVSFGTGGGNTTVTALGESTTGGASRGVQSADGGSTWATSNPGTGSGVTHIWGVARIDAGSGAAVGDRDPTGSPPPLTQSWHQTGGGSWQLDGGTDAPPSPGIDDHLRGVVTRTATNVWAVGYYLYSGDPSTFKTLTMYRGGATGAWTTVTSPNTGSDSNYLYSVAATGSDLWAVGYYYDSSGHRNRTLIMRYTVQ